MSLLPIAERWFERRRVDDDVTLLWEPHVHPFLRCNIWHVRGRDSDLLIDTGMGIANLASAARDLFEKPLVCVLTHTHMDHCGGAHEFGCVCAHPLEAEALARAEDGFPIDIAQWDAASIEWIRAMGYDISGGILTAIPYEGFDPSAHRLLPAVADRTISEGDVISTGDRSFEVLHLPGHSPGSIGLWEASSGTLFSGDAIYDGPLLDAIPGADIPTYRETMARLRALPVRTVHAGHEASFGRERLVALVDAYLQGASE